MRVEEKKIFKLYMPFCVCVCEIVVDANTRKVEIIQKKLNKICIYIYIMILKIFLIRKNYTT